MTKKAEIGQMAWGNPTGDYGTETLQDALIAFLLVEIDRVYWNKNQQDLGDNYSDCNLDGVELRSYYWGDDEEEQKKPNLKFDFSPQEIRWYKHPGRGQSCSIKWKTKEWIDWFNKALKVINKK